MARTSLRLQSSCWSALNIVRASSETEAADTTPQVKIGVTSWQWDETSQRLKSMERPRLDGEKGSGCAPVAIQEMVQSGSFSSMLACRGEVTASRQEPYFVRPVQLERGSADYLLEGILRNHPVDFGSQGRLRDVAASHDVVILAFTMDRASANFSLLTWLLNQVSRPGIPRNILFHAEQCVAHGIWLAKHRAQAGKVLLARSMTLTTLMRNWRTADAFRNALLTIVREFLTVVKQRRPDHLKQRAESFVDTLLVDPDGAHLRRRKGDDVVESPLWRDYRAVVDAIDLGPGGITSLVHWCHVEEGSSARLNEGLAVGGACCRDREQSVERVSVPLINALVHRQWKVQAASRWTHVSNTLRRMSLGFLAKGILPEALKELKCVWGVDSSMSAMLAALIAKDQNDFSAKGKLRLLRTCECLCRPEAVGELGIMVEALGAMDRFLYVVLGSQEK